MGAVISRSVASHINLYSIVERESKRQIFADTQRIMQYRD